MTAPEFDCIVIDHNDADFDGLMRREREAEGVGELAPLFGGAGLRRAGASGIDRA